MTYRLKRRQQIEMAAGKKGKRLVPSGRCSKPAVTQLVTSGVVACSSNENQPTSAAHQRCVYKQFSKSDWRGVYELNRADRTKQVRRSDSMLIAGAIP